MKPSDLKAVQEGMYEVVEESGGTGNATAKIPGVHLAGKTGTAQAYIKVDGEVQTGLEDLVLLLWPVRKSALRHLRGGRGRHMGRHDDGADRLRRS